MFLQSDLFVLQWMYIIPLGLIVMNAVTAAANIPEEAAWQGQPGAERHLLLPGGEDDGCLYVFPYRRYYHPFNYRHIVFCFFGYGVNITLTASSVVLHDDAIFCLC